MTTKDKEKILIIDDDVVLCKMLEKNFRREGYVVLEAHNGKEALELLRHQKVNLIILDVIMPVMDGFEFLQCLKIDEKCKDIPVIMLTVKDDKKSVQHGFDLKADFYLPKPVDFSNLLHFVQISLK
jgi:two-component system OmpR family response regulator